MHYQKVLKMPENIPYLSAGFDVGADFTWMSTILPNDVLIGKPFEITHSDPQFRELVISRTKEAQGTYSLEGRCFLESTGIYHTPLLCLPHDKGFDCAIINLIITKNSTNMDVGKLHNDKSDLRKAAKVGLGVSLKASIAPDDAIIDLRNLVRDYYCFKDPQSTIVLKLHAELRVSLPAYLNVFNEVITQTSLEPLEAYPLAADMLAAPKSELVETTRSTARFGETYALTRYDTICAAAKDAAVFRRALPSNALRIGLYIKMYREYQAYLDNILEELHQTIGKLEGMPDYDRISFIQTLHGVGFLGAVILIVEMGSFDLFSSSKEFYVYFGLDPDINDSGKFHRDRVHMSGRGFSLAKRILHMVATNNLKVDKATKTPANLVIYDYYTRECVSKKKSVAVGAAMRKIYNIVFAIFRDSKSSKLITPEECRERYIAEYPGPVNIAVRWRFELDFRIPWQ